MNARPLPRVTTADDAAALIPDGAVIAIAASGGGILEPDEVFAAIERRFLATGSPRNLTIVHGLGVGDAQTTGLNRFAHLGLVRRVIGGHWSWSPAMQQLATDGHIEAYSLPAGVIAALLRESGAHRPGLFSKVGLGSFVDPRRDGGKINDQCTTDLVEVVEIDGDEYLHYKPLQVDVAIVRGSSADGRCNVTAAAEASSLDSVAAAAAARGNGGLVIAQVKERVATGSLDPRLVNLPSPLVDLVVVHPDQWQTYVSEHEPAFYSAAADAPDIPKPASVPLARRIVARRAAQEVRPGDVVNVGYGMSAGVVDVLREDGRLEGVRLAIEQGAVGGFPETGDLFGLSRHPEALLSSATQFDLFATGMIDIALLGMAELDREGNVNVSRLGDRVVGPGGFLDIVHGARRVVFCGTFTARGLAVGVENGQLAIDHEGAVRKVVPNVSHVTFDAAAARARGQEVTYVTERAVFRLGADGLELVEVAPGLDAHRDVIAHLDFPIHTAPRAQMPAELFLDRAVPAPLITTQEMA
jgi:propionate CoA-transferase